MSMSASGRNGVCSNAPAVKLSAEELHDISEKSNKVLKDLGPDIRWLQSYVTEDKIYCVYVAPDTDVIFEHANHVTNDAGVRHAGADLDPQRPQVLRDEIGRAGFAIGELGVGMDVAPPRDDLAFDLGGPAVDLDVEPAGLSLERCGESKGDEGQEDWAHGLKLGESPQPFHRRVCRILTPQRLRSPS